MYEESATDLQFRDEFFVYMRDVDIFTEHKIGLNNRWGSAETYARARKVTKGNAATPTKVKMRVTVHFRGWILGLCDLTISVRLGKLIAMRILEEIRITVNIKGSPFKSC